MDKDEKHRVDRLSDEEIFEKIVSDSCEWDRKQGALSTEDEHRKFMGDICEDIDKKKANKKPMYSVGTEPAPPARLPVWLQPEYRQYNMKDLLLRQRIKRLAASPEWKEKLVGPVNPHASKGRMGDAAYRQVTAHYERVIAESNKVFGHWEKEMLRLDVDDGLNIIFPTKGF